MKEIVKRQMSKIMSKKDNKSKKKQMHAAANGANCCKLCKIDIII